MASRWCSISFREAWLSISFQSFWSFQCEPSKPPWGLEDVPDVPCWTPAGATHWSMLELEIESKSSSKTRSEERPTSLHGHPWNIPISRPPKGPQQIVRQVCLPWSTSPARAARWDSALGSWAAYWGAMPLASPWRSKPGIDRPTSLPHTPPDLAWS